MVGALQIAEYCDEIVVGTNVSIFGPDGRGLFYAGTSVTFGSGLAVLTDGELVVGTGLPLPSAAPR